MIRRALTWVAVLATIGLAAFIANAIAQTTHVVKAVDPLGNPPASANDWDPNQVEVGLGDTVSWQFDQAGFAHNLFLILPDQTERHLSLEAGCPGDHPVVGGACPPNHPPITYDFDESAEEGIYTYVCKIHAAPNAEAPGGWVGMVGQIAYGEEPPPPPQMPNPTEFGPPWEIGTEPPRMLGAKAKGLKRGVRLRLRVSHPGRVNVRFRRGGKVVLKRNLKGLRQGANNKRIRNKRLGGGRYQVQLRYRDQWGLPGQPKVVKRKVRVRY